MGLVERRFFFFFETALSPALCRFENAKNVKNGKGKRRLPLLPSPSGEQRGGPGPGRSSPAPLPRRLAPSPPGARLPPRPAPAGQRERQGTARPRPACPAASPPEQPYATVFVVAEPTSANKREEVPELEQARKVIEAGPLPQTRRANGSDAERRPRRRGRRKSPTKNSRIIYKKRRGPGGARPLPAPGGRHRSSPRRRSPPAVSRRSPLRMSQQLRRLRRRRRHREKRKGEEATEAGAEVPRGHVPGAAASLPSRVIAWSVSTGSSE